MTHKLIKLQASKKVLKPVTNGSIALSTSGFVTVLARGYDTTRNVSLVRTSFTGTVTPTVEGLPTGVTYSFSPTTSISGNTTFVLTLTATSDADLVTTESITVRAEGSGVTDATTTFDLSVVVAGTPLHNATIQNVTTELPRGVTSNNDVMLVPDTWQMSARGGSSYSPLWDWHKERVGAARWAARTTRTITSLDRTTATAEWLTHVAAFEAGTGDWEIVVPSTGSILLDVNVETGWYLPLTGTRRLYITNSVLPTADVMPSQTWFETYACKFVGRNNYTTQGMMWWQSSNSTKITMTGVWVQPQGGCIYGGILTMQNGTASGMSDVPLHNVLDRVWVDGRFVSDNPYEYRGAKSGVFCNAQQNALLEVYITDITTPLYPDKDASECKGYFGYSGTKFNFLRNVYAEASSICYLHGGADPSVIDGTMDPTDNVWFQCVSAKKEAWLTEVDGHARADIKNGFEEKDGDRLLVLNCITYNVPGCSQAHAMIFQTHQDPGASNYQYVSIRDITILNHKFKNIQNGPNVLAAISFGGGPLPTHHAKRYIMYNFLFDNLGENYGNPYSGLRGQLGQLSGDLEDFAYDRWTVINTSGIRNALRMINGGSPATNIQLTNIGGDNEAMIYYVDDDHGYAGLNGLDMWTEGNYTYDGNVAIGPPNTDFGSGTYTPGRTYYDNDTDAKFNRATGIFTDNTDGVDGTSTGCDIDALNTALASVEAWAYLR